MNITGSLRKHLEEKFGLPAGATDEVVRKSASERIVSGELTPAQLNELTAVKETAAANAIGTMIDDRISKAMGPVNDALEKLTKHIIPAGNDGAALVEGQMTQKGLALGGAPAGATQPSGPDPITALGAAGAAASQGAAGGDVRVKSVFEDYGNSRTALTYAMSTKAINKAAFGNQQVYTSTDPADPLRRPLDVPTDRDKAIAGVWMKRMVNRAFRENGMQVPPAFILTEWDKKAIEEIVHTCKFVGPIGATSLDDDSVNEGNVAWMRNKQVASEMWRKTLLDDTSTGGQYAVPIEFDALAVLTPLLNGELFPRVTSRTVTRRRIEGFSVGNPTVGWGVADGSAVTPFVTTGFVGAFNTNVWPLTGAFEMGLDFESDSPVPMGEMIVSNYGERFREEMDAVLANGSGSDRPKGLFQTAGLTVIPSENGTGGPPTVTDYELLMFGVAKQFRAQAGAERSVFIGNETSYQRARSIPVGPADERRVFGMTHEDYRLLSHPYVIIPSLSNSYVGFFCLNRYRLYRRAGFEVRIETAGRTLALANKRLIVVRARFGGQFDHASAGVIMTTAQS